MDRFSDTYRILDAKCSDGLNTEKGVINEYRDRIDAITIAPASWDDVSYIDFLHDTSTWNKVDVISMWAMSFPGTISDLILWSYDQQKAKIARNLEAGIDWVVMWATAFNTDVVSELEKIKKKVKEWNVEYACLKWYSDEGLVNWILLRNKLFEEVLWLIDENGDSKILVPGYWRQWGSWDFFISSFDHSEKSHFNAWSDIVKWLESEDVSNAREEVLKRLEAFLSNIQSFKSTAWERNFIVPKGFEFEKILHTWNWEELFRYIWAFYNKPENGKFCRLASGLLSDAYINIWATERNYRVVERAAHEMAEQIKAQNIQADVVMWAQMWSVRMSLALAEKLAIEESVYTEKSWEDNKGMELKRHDIDLKWKKIILSEDIVTKWSTLVKMIDLVTQAWGEVVGIACVGNRYGKDSFNDIPLISCYNPPAFKLYWDENTPQEARWDHPELPKGSKISEKPKNDWPELVKSMRK